MGTHVQPTVMIPDTDGDILNYLVRRTADTIGHLVESADVVVVGTAEASIIKSVRVAPEDSTGLNPWLSGAAGQQAMLHVEITSVSVERWLKGHAEAGRIDIAYVHPSTVVDGGPDVPPSIDASERRIFFLREIDPDVPYAHYIPKPAYHLAFDHASVRTLAVAADNGQSTSRVADASPDIEQTIEAIQWFVDVQGRTNDARRQAFLDTLDDPNPRIARHAVRGLSRYEGVADVLEREARQADDVQRTRLMLALWLSGAHSAALDLLEEIFSRHGKSKWLAGWGVNPVEDENGNPTDFLVGPAPDFDRGD